MIRHVVLFAWTDDMTGELEQQFASELTALAATLPQVLSYQAGPDAGVIEGNYDFAVTADFDDVESYLAYRDNPAHQDIIGGLHQPHIKERASVQYEI